MSQISYEFCNVSNLIRNWMDKISPHIWHKKLRCNGVNSQCHHTRTRRRIFYLRSKTDFERKILSQTETDLRREVCLRCLWWVISFLKSFFLFCDRLFCLRWNIPSQILQRIVVPSLFVDNSYTWDESFFVSNFVLEHFCDGIFSHLKQNFSVLNCPFSSSATFFLKDKLLV